MKNKISFILSDDNGINDINQLIEFFLSKDGIVLPEFTNELLKVVYEK